MYCMNCTKHIEDCLCPDKEERLTRVSDSTLILAPISWCLECDRPQSCCPHVKEITTHVKTGGRIVRKLDIWNPLTGDTDGEIDS